MQLAPFNQHYMKGLIVYRLISVLVNMLAMLLGGSLLLALPGIFSSPISALSAFLILSTVLYAWFANKFFVTVFIRQGEFTKKQKDWLQVNAIVTIIFAAIYILVGLVAYTRPVAIMDIVKVQFPPEVQDKLTAPMIKQAAIIAICIYAPLFIHVIWTISLVRKYFAHLKNTPPPPSDMDMGS